MCGKVGRVVSVNREHGRPPTVSVNFGHYQTYSFSPACCLPTHSALPDPVGAVGLACKATVEGGGGGGGGGGRGNPSHPVSVSPGTRRPDAQGGGGVVEKGAGICSSQGRASEGRGRSGAEYPQPYGSRTGAGVGRSGSPDTGYSSNAPNTVSSLTPPGAAISSSADSSNAHANFPAAQRSGSLSPGFGVSPPKSLSPHSSSSSSSSSGGGKKLGGGGGGGDGDVQVTNNANKDVKVNNDVNNSGRGSDSGLYCIYFL
jgi:hypothetical protein